MNCQMRLVVLLLQLLCFWQFNHNVEKENLRTHSITKRKIQRFMLALFPLKSHLTYKDFSFNTGWETPVSFRPAAISSYINIEKSPFFLCVLSNLYLARKVSLKSISSFSVLWFIQFIPIDKAWKRIARIWQISGVHMVLQSLLFCQVHQAFDRRSALANDWLEMNCNDTTGSSINGVLGSMDKVKLNELL